VLAVGLGLPGLLPALVVARRSAVAIFLAPLIGAGMAAIAADVELGVGGSLLTLYVAIAVIVNMAAAAWWLTVGRLRDQPAGLPLETSILAAVLILAVLVIPLSALRVPYFGFDAEQIDLTHALMYFGGHHKMVTYLTDHAYWSSHPDYPPLVPAVGALAFSIFGTGNLRVSPELTVLLHSCALGVLGMGIASVAAKGRQLTQLAAAVAGATICLAGFAMTWVNSVDGFTDLLWASAAASAVVWGLVLPRSGQALGIAWICAVCASLTKNEGLTTALILFVLIAFRYRPLTLPEWRDLRSRRLDRTAVRSWLTRAAMVIVPALPGLVWVGLIHRLGLNDAFLRSTSRETLATRAQATFLGMGAHYAAILPVAAGALIVGCWFLRKERARAGMANPAWLWLAWLGANLVIFGVYLVGSLEIHSWLASSVLRTTVFGQLVLYAELLVWFVVAVETAFARYGRHEAVATPAVTPVEAGQA
jgi:hypothetical protein